MTTLKRGLSILLGALASSFFLPALAAAVHEPVPDMEHGESVVEEAAPAPAGEAGKAGTGQAGKIGGGDVLFEVKGAGNVTFSHERHVAGIGLKCTDCHDRLYVTREKDKPATMAQMRQGHSCGACHDGKTAFDVKGNCAKCHQKK